MLKEIRTEKGLSQSQLANISDISIRTIQAWEVNERDINKASISNIVKLATSLDCKITDLLTDKDLIKQCKKVTL